MAKLISPPSIAHLDELLELILDPKKFAGYLKDMKDLRDQITALLEQYSDLKDIESAKSDLASKQAALKADLSQLSARIREFENSKIVEEGRLSKLKSALEQERVDLKQAKAELVREYSHKLLELDQQLKVVGEREKAAYEKECAVAIRESAIGVKEAELLSWLSKKPVQS